MNVFPQVLVRMLAAPVNPADINTVQGVYAVKPPLPSVPGNEGIGEVLEIGRNSHSELQPGDHVIPRVNAFGTWRTHAITTPSELIKVKLCFGGRISINHFLKLMILSIDSENIGILF